MSQVLDMARRLEEAERIIEELQNGGARRPASASDDWSPLTAESQGRGTERTPSVPTLNPPTTARQTVQTPPAAMSNTMLSSNRFQAQADVTAPLHTAPTVSDTTTPQEISADVSIDERGALCYYGPTSAVHDPLATSAPSPQVVATTAGDYLPRAKAALIAKAKESRMWEGFAISNATVQSDIPRQVVSKLLQLNWTWTSPMFMWVYRPAFMGQSYAGNLRYTRYL